MLPKTLSTFMVNDMPDTARFFREIVVWCLFRQPPKRRKESILVLWLVGNVRLSVGRKRKPDAAIRLGRNNSGIAVGTAFKVNRACAGMR